MSEAVSEGTESASSSSSFQYGVIQRMIACERRTTAHQRRVFTCLYRDGTGGCVRGADGIAAEQPGSSLGSACSVGSKKLHSQCRGCGFESHHLHLMAWTPFGGPGI